jgi:hypothetical protein
MRYSREELKQAFSGLGLDLSIMSIIQPVIDQYQSQIQAKFGAFYTQRNRIFGLQEKALALSKAPETQVIGIQYSGTVGTLLGQNDAIQKDVDAMVITLKQLGDNTGASISQFKFNLSKMGNLGASALNLIKTLQNDLPNLFNRMDAHTSDITNLETLIQGKIAQYNIGISNVGGQLVEILKQYGIWLGVGLAGIIGLSLMTRGKSESPADRPRLK